MMNEDGGTVIDLVAERNKRGMAKHDPYYQIQINRMSKMELLEEMVRYQDERSLKGKLTLTMMVRGRILFQALEMNAETDELRLLASSYRRHLEHEIELASKPFYT
jgi:Tfp pilus assembly protein PilN